MMTFKEWWQEYGHELIEEAYTHTEYLEIKKIAHSAWVGACFRKSCEDVNNLCDVCRTEVGVFHNYCQTCGRDLEGE